MPEGVDSTDEPMTQPADAEVLDRLRAVDQAIAAGAPASHPALVQLRWRAHLHALADVHDRQPVPNETRTS
jgi:hypothetical protein